MMLAPNKPTQMATETTSHTVNCPGCDATGMVYPSDDPEARGHECTDCDGTTRRVGYLREDLDCVISAAEVEQIHDETIERMPTAPGGGYWCTVADCPLCPAERTLRAQIECWYDSECDGETIVAQLGKYTTRGRISYRDNPSYMSEDEIWTVFVGAAEEAIHELLWSMRNRK